MGFIPLRIVEDMAKLKFVTTLTVSGGCTICKSRIENHLYKRDGIISAKWDMKTNNLSLEITHGKVQLEEIHQTIAALGHSTELIKANHTAISELPTQCQTHI